MLKSKTSQCGEKDSRLITFIVAYFHGNSPQSRSGNLALLANDTELVIILAPGYGPPSLTIHAMNEQLETRLLAQVRERQQEEGQYAVISLLSIQRDNVLIRISCDFFCYSFRDIDHTFLSIQ